MPVVSELESVTDSPSPSDDKADGTDRDRKKPLPNDFFFGFLFSQRAQYIHDFKFRCCKVRSSVVDVTYVDVLDEKLVLSNSCSRSRIVASGVSIRCVRSLLSLLQDDL